MARSTAYSSVQLLLHWSIAALVLFQLSFGESMTTVVDAADSGNPASATDQNLASAHFWVGIGILALMCVRIVVRVTQGAPEPMGGGIAARLAKLMHAAFYLLLLAIPATGLLAVYVADFFGDIHSAGKPVLIALIALHFAGAVFHQFWLKDGTLARMLTRR